MANASNDLKSKVIIGMIGAKLDFSKRFEESEWKVFLHDHLGYEEPIYKYLVFHKDEEEFRYDPIECKWYWINSEVTLTNTELDYLINEKELFCSSLKEYSLLVQTTEDMLRREKEGENSFPFNQLNFWKSM